MRNLFTPLFNVTRNEWSIKKYNYETSGQDCFSANNWNEDDIIIYEREDDHVHSWQLFSNRAHKKVYLICNNVYENCDYDNSDDSPVGFVYDSSSNITQQINVDWNKKPTREEWKESSNTTQEINVDLNKKPTHEEWKESMFALN